MGDNFWCQYIWWIGDISTVVVNCRSSWWPLSLPQWVGTRWVSESHLRASFRLSHSPLGPSSPGCLAFAVWLPAKYSQQKNQLKNDCDGSQTSDNLLFKKSCWMSPLHFVESSRGCSNPWYFPPRWPSTCSLQARPGRMLEVLRQWHIVAMLEESGFWKNKKCPIDMHCHGHCRKVARITKDCMEFPWIQKSDFKNQISDFIN